MDALFGLSFLAILAAIPAVLIFLAIEAWLLKFSRYSKVAAALSGGILVSGLFMANDAETGFCCREYRATFLTELWLYVPLALSSAFIAYPIVALVARIRRKIIGRRNAEPEIYQVFE